MSWPLKEITLDQRRAMNYTDVEPGTCWRIPLSAKVFDETYRDLSIDWVSPEFTASGRDYLIVVRLPPGGGDFFVDYKSTDGASGWIVTGEMPVITVSPSINAAGAYHGWIQNGVLTDDCEGRKYE